MEKFKELKVWQKAHKLVLEVYQITSRFPDSEKFGLVSQMRRAAVSIAANIVEGTKRRTPADRTHFNIIADTSLEELKYYFIVVKDLRFLKPEELEKLTSAAREIGAMLTGLTKSFK